MSRRSSHAPGLAAFAASLLLAASAAGEGHMSMQAGGFVPFQGDAGPTFLLQLLGSNASAKARFGAELEYRRFDTKIIEVRDVDAESYVIRAVWQQHFAPDAVVSPYLGLGLGVTINHVDDHKVDRAKGENVRNATGAGPDGVFMLGLQGRIPGADYLSLFAEGRVGFAFDFIAREDRSKLESENFGGASGSAGVRFRF